jgi:hypothetical protein
VCHLVGDPAHLLLAEISRSVNRQAWLKLSMGSSLLQPLPGLIADSAL